MAASCGIRCSVPARRRAEPRSRIGPADASSILRGRLTRRVLARVWLAAVGPDWPSEAESRVSLFDAASGVLELAAPLPNVPHAGQAYELVLRRGFAAAGDPLCARLAAWMRRSRRVSVRLGTTRGTNALLTRRGAATALVTTRGFGDVLRIGYQNRPKLFELAIRKPPPLVYCRGRNRRADRGRRRSAARAGRGCRSQAHCSELKSQGIESLAICLLHAYANPRHEQLVGRIAAESRLCGNQRFQPGGAAGQDRRPRRHDGRRRLSESRAADLRRRGSAKARRRQAADYSTSAGGLVEAKPVRRQGQHPFRAGRRRGRLLPRRQGGGLRARDRLRHGRNEHRRLAIRRPLRTRVRNRKGRRAGRGPDDGDRNRGRRRRLDLPLRRREAGRRSRKRRRRSRPGLLRPRRPAGDHRRELLSRQNPGRAFSISAGSRRSSISGWRRLPTRSSPPPAVRYTPHDLADGFLRVANAHMVKAIRVGLAGQGIRPARLRSGGLRRGGRATCLRRRRRSWACGRYCCIPTRACSAPTASAWPTSRGTPWPASAMSYSRGRRRRACRRFSSAWPPARGRKCWPKALPPSRSKSAGRWTCVIKASTRC